GTMTVTGTTSILSNGAINNSRVWGQAGTINIGSGALLTVESILGFRADVPSFLTGTGTLKLADFGTFTTSAALASVNARSTTMTFDLGTGASELMYSGATSTPDLGALTGGANTKLSGSTT